jgi:streptogramin lyase
MRWFLLSLAMVLAFGGCGDLSSKHRMALDGAAGGSGGSGPGLDGPSAGASGGTGGAGGSATTAPAVDASPLGGATTEVGGAEGGGAGGHDGGVSPAEASSADTTAPDASIVDGADHEAGSAGLPWCLTVVDIGSPPPTDPTCNGVLFYQPGFAPDYVDYAVGRQPAVGPDGNFWIPGGRLLVPNYDTGALAEYQGAVDVISTAGQLVMSLGLDGKLRGAKQIALGSDGNLWLTGSAYPHIARLTPAGRLTEFTLPNGRSASAVVAGRDGFIWYAEYASTVIGRVAPTGDVTEFALSGEPNGLAVGPDGNVWFSTSRGTGVDAAIGTRVTFSSITTDGLITQIAAIDTQYHWGPIAAGPDGNLWFIREFENLIGRVEKTGTITTFPLPSPRCGTGLGLYALTAGPDGNVWYTNYSCQTIGRMTPSGTVTELYLNFYPQYVLTGPDHNIWFTSSHGLGRIVL